LYAQASTSTHDAKRGELKRAVIGAVAAGIERVLLTRDLFRISENAVDTLGIQVDLCFLDLERTSTPRDTELAARAMRSQGCGALVVLGGDGTSRVVARAWQDAPLVPLTTGTNNVFPLRCEATVGGAAAGLVASGRLALEEVAQPAKLVHVEIDGEPDDLALVDVAFLVDDRVGNYLPFDPDRIRRIVLARAEPAAVGMSPVGGLLEPCHAEDDFGVEVQCDGHGGRRPLLAPLSPGLYRTVPVTDVRRIALDEVVEIRGPGILAFDGDRERTLPAGCTARLRVRRDGPRVIDVDRALELAARRGLQVGRGAWKDHDHQAGVDCC